MEYWLGALGRIAVAAAAVAGATALARLVGINPVTVGFVYLVTVLLLATFRGQVAGVAGSLLATGCFNYFFLPPTGTFHVADPENWVALMAFLVASTVASRLVASERRKAAEAEHRRRDLEALYDLSLDLFTAGATRARLDDAVARALRSLGAGSGGFLAAGLAGDAAWLGSAADYETHRLLATSPDADTSQVEVEIDGRIVGTLVAYGARAPRPAVEAVSRLVALAVERERLLGERARLQALQESDELRTALLRAVSHDLSTPMTAIGLHLEALRRELPADSEGGTTLAQLAEECRRLQRRTENLLAMARLEGGHFSPRREPSPAADLFRAAREHLAGAGLSPRLTIHVAENCPELDVDPSLVVEVLVNLIENAQQASPEGGPIELSARSAPGDRGWILLEVSDHGRGLGAPSEEAASRRGLGLEIARSFAAAHGGAVELEPRLPRGVTARVRLPAAPEVPQ